MGRSIQFPPAETPKNWAGATWSYRRRAIADVTEQAGISDGWRIACNQLGRGRYLANLDCLRLGRLVITRDRINLAIGQDTVSPTDSVSLLFPLRSDDGWRVDGHRETDSVVAIRQGETHLLIAPGSQSELVHVQIPAALLCLPSVAATVRSRRMEEPERWLLDWLQCLLGQARAGVTYAAGASAALEEMLLMRLATCIDGFSTPTAQTLRRSSAIDLLSRVERQLEEADDIPETFAALCAASSHSPLELAEAARSAFGQAPDRWYRLARLNGVHRELKAGNKGGVTVTRAATRWGFYHLGRFSADYAGLFGRHPRETLRVH
jgi:AraC-like DNA-binding protein